MNWFVQKAKVFKIVQLTAFNYLKALFFPKTLPNITLTSNKIVYTYCEPSAKQLNLFLGDHNKPTGKILFNGILTRIFNDI